MAMAYTPEDEKVHALARRYAWLTAAEMVAIPLPGADLVAVFATWSEMVKEIGAAYGHEVTREDAERLAGEFLKGALLTGCAWVGSAAMAGSLMRLFPGVGTVGAYLVDAAVAGVGTHTVTSGVAVAAGLYFKSGRAWAPKDLRSAMKQVIADPELLLTVLATFALSRPAPRR